MRKVLVYKDDIQIGFGYLIITPMGNIIAPDLFYNSGETMPSDWYDLVMTHEEHLVVLSRMIQ